MPFKLWFPNNKDAEPYTGLVDEEDVYEAVKEEVEKAISDDVLYDPSEFTPTGYDEEQDQDGTIWNEAVHDAIEHETMMATPQIFKELWQRYESYADGRGDTAEIDKAVDNTMFSKLPDGTKIALTEED
jgi:hypothetical protein